MVVFPQSRLNALEESANGSINSSEVSHEKYVRVGGCIGCVLLTFMHVELQWAAREQGSMQLTCLAM